MSETSKISCKNCGLLQEIIRKIFPNITVEHPNDLYTKFTFPDKLVLNVFNNGTVNFQGDDYQHPNKSDITALIALINRS